MEDGTWAEASSRVAADQSSVVGDMRATCKQYKCQLYRRAETPQVGRRLPMGRHWQDSMNAGRRLVALEMLVARA